MNNHRNEFIITTLLIFIWAIGCRNPSNTSSPTNAQNSVTITDTVAPAPLPAPVLTSLLPNDSVIYITDSSEIIVGELNKEYYEETPHREALATCRTWTLDSAQVVAIIKHSRPTDGPELHDIYNVYPCNFKAHVEIDKKPFELSVNGGSHFVLIHRDSIHADTAYLFACSDEKLSKLFIEGRVEME